VYPDERLQQPENWNTRGVKSEQRHPRERLNSIFHATTQAPTQSLTNCRQLEERKRIYIYIYIYIYILRMKNGGRRPPDTKEIKIIVGTVYAKQVSDR